MTTTTTTTTTNPHLPGLAAIIQGVEVDGGDHTRHHRSTLTLELKFATLESLYTKRRRRVEEEGV